MTQKLILKLKSSSNLELFANFECKIVLETQEHRLWNKIQSLIPESN